MARQEDYSDIYILVKEAFTTAQVSDGTEQDFVLKLRKSEGYIQDLEIVVEKEGKLIGHILFTKQVIKTEKEDFIGLLVAPLCVGLEYRNQKVGAKLMEYGFEKAKELGYTAVFLIGNPEYYKKFGYMQVGTFGIQNKTEVPDEFVLGCEIVEGALKNIKGDIHIIE